MKGKLYGVGVGPGDKELITLKALNVLKQADVIAVPDTKGDRNVALDIVQEYVEGTELLFIDTPMTRDENILNLAHEAAANTICSLLDNGKTVAFITLGDATVYSTYIYVHRLVVAKGYDTEIIPGVTSFCAVGARLNESLCDKETPLLIIPAINDSIDELLKVPANKVIMKGGRTVEDIKEKLKEHDLYDNAKMISRVGFSDEAIYHSLDEVEGSKAYLSVIVVKGN